MCRALTIERSRARALQQVCEIDSAVRKPSEYYHHPVGFLIEILPELNPYQLKPGDLLPIQVMFRDKPAADFQIEMAWLPPGEKSQIKITGRTGNDGRLKIPIVSKGIWKLHAVLMERCAEPAVADGESFGQA